MRVPYVPSGPQPGPLVPGSEPRRAQLLSPLADGHGDRLDTPALRAALDGANAPNEVGIAAAAELEASGAQLEELAKGYGQRQITFAELLAARKPIEARIEAARRVLSRQNHTTAAAEYVGNAADLRDRWDELSLSRQRAIVAALLDHVTVGPAAGPRFDSDRLAPVWRV